MKWQECKKSHFLYFYCTYMEINVCDSILFVVPILRPHKLFIFIWAMSSPRILLQCVWHWSANFYFKGETWTESHLLLRHELTAILSLLLWTGFKRAGWLLPSSPTLFPISALCLCDLWIVNNNHFLMFLGKCLGCISSLLCILLMMLSVIKL